MSAAAILRRYAVRQRQDSLLGLDGEEFSESWQESRIRELREKAELFYRRPDSVVWPKGYEEWLLGCAIHYLGGSRADAQAWLDVVRMNTEPLDGAP